MGWLRRADQSSISSSQAILIRQTNSGHRKAHLLRSISSPDGRWPHSTSDHRHLCRPHTTPFEWHCTVSTERLTTKYTCQLSWRPSYIPQVEWEQCHRRSDPDFYIINKTSRESTNDETHCLFTKHWSHLIHSYWKSFGTTWTKQRPSESHAHCHHSLYCIHLPFLWVLSWARCWGLLRYHHVNLGTTLFSWNGCLGSIIGYWLVFECCLMLASHTKSFRMLHVSMSCRRCLEWHDGIDIR